MAVRQATITNLQTFLDRDVHEINWAGLLNGDTGSVIEMPGSSDRSVQFTGTFGSGGTAVIEGSNDGVTYFTLKDPSSTAISKTSAGLSQILELTRYIRPHVTAGDGTTSLTCDMILKYLR